MSLLRNPLYFRLNNIFNLLAGCMILLLTLARGRAGLVEISSQFPVFSESSFVLQLSPQSGSDLISPSPKDIVVIFILDQNKVEKERAVINFGPETSLNNSFVGDFVTVRLEKKSPTSNKMNMSLFFKDKSNGLTLEIFLLNTTNELIGSDAFENLKLSTPVYRSTISLLTSSKIVLYLKSSGKRSNDLPIGQVAMATCQGGLPSQIARFSNLASFDVSKSILIIETRMRKIWFHVSIKDHLKTLRCSSGNNTANVTINVLHPPTQLVVNPPIGKTLPPNSSISCHSKDGYPVPHARWYFKKGPVDPEMYYQIRQNGSQLHMTANTPNRTLWQFYCAANFTNSKSGDRISKLVSFKIEEKYCDTLCLYDQIKILKQTTDLQNQINNNIMEILKRIESRQNDQFNKSEESLRKTSRNQMKILQESIANITKKYDSIGHQIKQEISEIKSNLRHSSIGVPNIILAINGITDKMDSSDYIYKYVITPNKRYRVWLRVYFYPDKLQMYLYSHRNEQYKAIYPIKLDVTISVANTISPYYYKIQTNTFVLNKEGSYSPYFVFEKEELTDMIRGDSTTIKCFIKLK